MAECEEITNTPTDSGVSGTDSPVPHANGEGKRRRRKKNKKKTVLSEEGAVLTMPNVLVMTSEEKGRHGITRRNLDAGDVIFEDEPLAFIIAKPHKDQFCTLCAGPVARARRQAGGDSPYHVYCGPACRARDAACRVLEDAACKQVDALAAEAEVDVDLLRMLAKMLARHALRARAGAEDPLWEGVLQLQTHRENTTAEWLACVEKGVEKLLALMPAQAQVAVDLGVDLACRVNMNAHGIGDASGRNASVGFGMFPRVALLNHSCQPNAIYTFGGPPGAQTMAVRALAPLRAGEEVTLHYIDLLQARGDRQRELRATRFFDCACPRCEEPRDEDLLLQAICCARCGPAGVLVRRLPDELLPPELRAAAAAAASDGGAAAAAGGGGGGGEAEAEEFWGKGEGEEARAARAAAAAAAGVYAPSFLNQESEEALAAMRALGVDPERVQGLGLQAAALPPALKGGGGGGKGGGGGGAAVVGVTDPKAAAALLAELPPAGVCFCNACHKTQATQEAIDGFVQACAKRRHAGEVIAHRLGQGGRPHYGVFKQQLEEFLEVCDASKAAAAPKKKGGKVQIATTPEEAQELLRLHPSHSLVVYALNPLANACNAVGDFLGAARHLRRLIALMTALQPEAFPETADFLHALGEALRNFVEGPAERRPGLRARPAHLPRKTQEAYRQEYCGAFLRCHRARAVCFGHRHRATREALGSLEAVAHHSREAQAYLAALPPEARGAPLAPLPLPPPPPGGGRRGAAAAAALEASKSNKALPPAPPATSAVEDAQQMVEELRSTLKKTTSKKA